jgi:hypothetical protein
MPRRFVAWVMAIPIAVLRLVRDLADVSGSPPDDAMVDDVLDAARDEDGMNATGL